jgi:hypothetical protein
MDQQFLQDQVKGKIKNSTANYGPKKWGSSKRCVFFCTVFFLKKSVFQIRVSKKMECPDFFFISWIFV